MSDNVSRIPVQILLAHEAKKNGDFDSLWIRGFVAAARMKGCAAALVPLRLVHEIIQGSLTKAAEIVAADQAGRLAKLEDEGEESVAARAATAGTLVPAGQITAASLEKQWALASLIYQWTYKGKDWAMFNKLDPDDPELGTKMQLLVMRKYLSSGSAPSQNWILEMHHKQRESETSEDVWDRIKTCAAALESAGRTQTHLSIIDALKVNLGPAHTSWVNNIDDSYTIEDVDAAVFKHGMFVDQTQGKSDSLGKAAYAAAETEDSRDRTI